MVEKVGNKVPHPVVIFLILIAIVVVLSHILYLSGTSVTTQVIEPTATSCQDATLDMTPDYTYPTATELQDYQIEKRRSPSRVC